MVREEAGGHYAPATPLYIATTTPAAKREVTKMTGTSTFGRRQFLEVAAGALTSTQLVPAHAASVRQSSDKSIKLAQFEGPDPFSSLKQIDAGVLNVGYVEAGPARGPVAVLLHGWPYDIH